MVARAESAEATRMRILEAARRQFGELPYEQVSLGLIAQQAGVTVQTVLRRFESKEHLFAAVAAWRAASIAGERDAVAAGDAAGAIQTLVDSYERWGDEVLHLLAEERRSPVIREVTEFGRRYHHAWVRRVFTPQLRGLGAEQRERRLVRLIAVTDLYTWKILRRDLDLSSEETEEALRDLTEHTLGASRHASG
jgi:AcrR family transcriptional regulator